MQKTTEPLASSSPGGPGVGKSHALSAVGHALVEAGHSVLCAPAYALVHERRRETRPRPAQGPDRFSDQMATAAAIDRLVHHAVVLDVPPGLAAGRPRKRPDGPGAERPVDRASGMENARGPSCQVVPPRRRVSHPAFVPPGFDAQPAAATRPPRR